MFKIEKFLLDHKFKKVKEYESGVIVYDDADEEYEYITEVAVFTTHEPLVYEVMTRNPYAVTLNSRHNYSKKFWKEEVKTYQCLAKDHIEYAENTFNWLKNEVENPWEEVNE